ncbi:MAG: RDD family protein [Deltaproteobacteria bacterium]|nr:RDD family protein [Deltaproteobacteria bacterium]
MSTYSVDMAKVRAPGPAEEAQPATGPPLSTTATHGSEPRDGEIPLAKVYVVGLWRRMAAAVIDLTLVAPVIAIAAFVVIKVAGGGLSTWRVLRPELLLELALQGGWAFYGSITLVLLLALLYGFVFISTVGSTPGLRWMRVRVINIYGDRPEWWRVLLRGVSGVVGLLLLGLGMLWIGFDREKRGLHDWIAGTYAIRSGVAHQARG